MTLMELYDEIESAAMYFGGCSGAVIMMVADGFYYEAEADRLPDKLHFEMAKMDLEHVLEEDKKNKVYKKLIKDIDKFVEEHY